jgi:hypothetical protein
LFEDQLALELQEAGVFLNVYDILITSYNLYLSYLITYRYLYYLTTIYYSIHGGLERSATAKLKQEASAARFPLTI